MADDMGHLDDLPKRDANHVAEEKAEAALQARLAASGRFILQRSDRKDYGTDCEIEVVDQEQATNVRVHVQLKGTERPLNADASLSIEVSRSNLNYLLMHPHSFYAAYHIPTSSLRICPAETVLHQYEHAGKNWTHQQSLTVNFTDELTNERLNRLATLARSAARAARDRRVEQTRAAPGNVAGLVRRGIPDIHIPDDPALAGQLLALLYNQDADVAISAAFDRFAAVLGVDSEAMGPAYMAEVNLGMAGLSRSRARIEAAVNFFRNQLDLGRYERGSLQYTVGNAFSALGQEEDAKAAYEAALADPAFAHTPDLASQGHKNLGTSFERLGDEKRAVEHYREALRLNPHLPEAHNAIAQFYVRHGEWKHALAHLDQAVFTDPARAKAAGVAGWRANVLFNMGEGSAAFREINSLLVQADSEPWIWPFSHGWWRASVVQRRRMRAKRWASGTAMSAPTPRPPEVVASCCWPLCTCERRERMLAAPTRNSVPSSIAKSSTSTTRMKSPSYGIALGTGRKMKRTGPRLSTVFGRPTIWRAVTTATALGPPSTFSVGLKRACQSCANRPSASSLTP
ncbi:DUF4365 domain-containing protein [Paracoccus sp. J56]|uniref:DUF4365 domain-containing protein n=1 Tax=Paracoccus sp. J56 TaxID=935850 RepID=UPI001C384AF1|nr:DUF4365 domain-containing protein [Paracoccus sp. J56]